jgi:hypothetical protein
MLPLVYIETTIPSFFFEVRSDPEMVARRIWTREWWEGLRHLYSLVTSEAVIAELEEGDYQSQNNAVDLLKNVELLDAPDEIADIIDVYLDNHLMPRSQMRLLVDMELSTFSECQ